MRFLNRLRIRSSIFSIWIFISDSSFWIASGEASRFCARSIFALNRRSILDKERSICCCIKSDELSFLAASDVYKRQLLDDQPSQSDADTLASDERNQMEATISKLKESNDAFRRQVEELEFEIANQRDQRESAEKKNAASMKKLEAKMKESKLESNDEFRRQVEALELEIANQRDQRKSAEKKNAALMKKLEAKMKESKMNSARAVARARREAEKAMAALSQLQDRKNSAQLASQLSLIHI